MRRLTLAIDVATLVLGSLQPTHLAVCTICSAIHTQTVPGAVMVVKRRRTSTVRVEATILYTIAVQPIYRVDTKLLLPYQTKHAGTTQRLTCRGSSDWIVLYEIALAS